jgi:hypothetical protein
VPLHERGSATSATTPIPIFAERASIASIALDPDGQSSQPWSATPPRKIDMTDTRLPTIDPTALELPGTYGIYIDWEALQQPQTQQRSPLPFEGSASSNSSNTLEPTLSGATAASGTARTSTMTHQDDRRIR